MKLSDVMSEMQLSTYAEVGLLLFLAAFLAVVVDVVRRGREYDARGNLPLSSDGERTSNGEADS
jgi:hypothetical protein